jgi:hypothetical protein
MAEATLSSPTQDRAYRRPGHVMKVLGKEAQTKGHGNAGEGRRRLLGREIQTKGKGRMDGDGSMIEDDAGARAGGWRSMPNREGRTSRAGRRVDVNANA